MSDQQSLRIVAIVLDYVKKDDAKGTWLESHFSWQIRTFWWGLNLVEGKPVPAVPAATAGT